VVKFIVKYENAPNFCFLCGRIGHDADDCPEEHVNRLVKNYGVWLRPSPVRKDEGKKIQIQPAGKVIKHLNFMGDQRDKVIAAAASSSSRHSQHGAPGEELDTQLRLGQRRDRDGNFLNRVPPMAVDACKSMTAATEELAKGVQDMVVEGGSLKLSENPLFGEEAANSAEKLGSESEEEIKEKVSGLNSFLGSTDNSAATSLREEEKAPKGLTMDEKLQRAKNMKSGIGVGSKGISKPGEKFGKNKKLP
jgi:hypothetical protein